MRKAVADLVSLLPLLISLVLIIGGLWWTAESLKAMLSEVGQKVVLVMPYYDVKLKTCGCQVSVIKQT